MSHYFSGSVFIWTSPLVFFAYSLIAYYLLYRAYGRWPWWQLALGILAGVAVNIGLRYVLEQVIIDSLIGHGNYKEGVDWRYYVVDNLYYAILYTSVGLVYFLSEQSRRSAERAQLAELARRETELRFLRSQINPHFLFNTLNSLYAQVSQGSPLALASLERLSGLLRYSLYEQATVVTLERELTYITNFIEMENLRLGPDQRIKLRIGTLMRDWQLPPMLLVPFVENVFKHGRAPAYIAVEEQDGLLVFTAQNAYRRAVPPFADEVQPHLPTDGGIGLKNTRHRLELLYPGRHSLHVAAGPHTFTARLLLSPRP